jgi:phosphoribosylaminoimidazole carboxylase (NCAIR synthetase)
MQVLLLFPTNQNNLERWCKGAQNFGINLAVIEYTSRPLCYPSHVGPVIQVDKNVDDVAGVLPLIEGLTLSGVVAYSEPAVLLAHRLAKTLGLPHNPRLQPEAVREKTLMRELLREAGLTQPRTILTTDGPISAADLQSARFPVVVKPDDGVGSFGVRLSRTADEAVDAVAAVLRADPFAGIGWSIGNEVTIEEFVDGPSFSCDAIVVGGEVLWSGVTAHFKAAEPYFDDVGQIFPASARSSASELRQMAQDAVSALGIDNGVCNVEFRETEDGPVIIEVANRVAATGIPQMIELVTGIMLEESALSIATGRGHVARHGTGRYRYAGSRLHFASNPGIGFPDDAVIVESIVHARPQRDPTARATQITELVGMTVVCGDNPTSITEWAQAGIPTPAAQA